MVSSGKYLIRSCLDWAFIRGYTQEFKGLEEWSYVETSQAKLDSSIFYVLFCMTFSILSGVLGSGRLQRVVAGILKAD